MKMFCSVFFFRFHGKRNYYTLFLAMYYDCLVKVRGGSVYYGLHTVCKNYLLNHKQMTKQMTIVVIGSLRVNSKYSSMTNLSHELKQLVLCLPSKSVVTCK